MKEQKSRHSRQLRPLLGLPVSLESMGRHIQSTAWLVVIFATRLASACLADTPTPNAPAVFSSEDGSIFARIEYRPVDDRGLDEVVGAVFRVGENGRDTRLWEIAGIRTYFEVVAYPSRDQRHLVVVLPRQGGVTPSVEDIGLYIFDRERLVRKYSLLDLVHDADAIRRTTGSYFWTFAPSLLVASESETSRPDVCGFVPGTQRFYLQTVEGDHLEFDVTTGDFIRLTTTVSPWWKFWK